MKIAKKNNRKSAKIAEDLAILLLRKAPAYEIISTILGGKQFMLNEPVSGLDFLTASRKGVSKFSIKNLACVIQVPMKDMAVLLGISCKTLAGKKKTDVFGNLVSSLSIEIAISVAKGLMIFEDREKLICWLHKENKALNLQKPFDMLNTPTGIKLVNQILGRIENGVYS